MIVLNENKKVSLTKDEAVDLCSLVGDDANAGIEDAKEIHDKIYNKLSKSGFTSGGTIEFTNSDLQHLEYYKDLITKHKNSPKVKYMYPAAKSAISKIFGLKESVDVNEAFLHVSPELSKEIEQCLDRAHGNIHSFFKDLEGTLEYYVSDDDKIKKKYTKDFIDSLEKYIKEIRSSCRV